MGAFVLRVKRVYKINQREIIERYMKCESSSDVISIQNEYLEELDREHQGFDIFTKEHILKREQSMSYKGEIDLNVSEDDEEEYESEVEQLLDK